MSKLKKLALSEEVRIAFTILQTMALIIAAYITYRLAPIEQNLNNIVQRVEAVEKAQDNYVDKDEFNQVVKQIDTIDRNVDTLLKLHLAK